jgi:hypothetical protein
MPTRLIPKITELKWTADGQVVILSGNLIRALAAGRAAPRGRSIEAVEALRHRIRDLVSAAY